MVDSNNRCGFDEADARGQCGAKCSSDADCGTGELCFATMLNLCSCFESIDVDGKIKASFDKASSTIEPFFLGALNTGGGNDKVATEGGKVEGKPRSDASMRFVTFGSLLVSILAIFALH